MTASNRAKFIPIDQRDPSTVRAVILARSSDPGAKAQDMSSQVERSKAFIEAHGWRLVADTYAFTEAATGMRNVARPVLQDVLKLAVRGDIDVIVAAEMERIARSEGRRWRAIQTAEDHGVEFRFANLPPDGKLPDDPMQKTFGALRSFYAQAEAERIRERTWPPKQRRFELGLPHGGRSGPLWGYGEGERRMGKHGHTAGLLSWVVDESEAVWVRWLFDTVDSRLAGDISLRGLAGELKRRGVPTATGTGAWSSKQVRNVLTQPKYAGLGRNLRYHTRHVQMQDGKTREVAEVTRTSDRMRDPDAYRDETFPIPTDAVPAIITPEQFERVQAKLAEARGLHNRGGTRRQDELAQSALLDGGFVFCHACGNRLTRYWASRKNYPFYQCKHGGVPDHPGHPPFQVPAPFVDQLAIKLLAKALTDPEDILALASAAEEQLPDASIEASLSASVLAAHHQWLSSMATERDALLKALTALSHVSGMEGQVNDIRARLAQLDRDLAEAEGDHATAGPRHEQAQAREAFLRALFTQRGKLVNFALDAAGWMVDDEEWLLLGQEVRLDQAAALLGMSEEEVRAMLPVREDEVDGVLEPQVSTERVVRLLLERLGRERLRKLMDDLGVAVMVKRGRTRAEWLEKGPIALSERVTLQVMGTVAVRTDQANLAGSHSRSDCHPPRAPVARSR